VSELITLSELQMKEVIMMNGRRLGFIEDLEIDEQNGFIIAIIIVERQGKGSFFQKPDEKVISWKQILTIGNDIILVNDSQEEEKTDDSSVK